MATTNARMRQLRATESEWATENPILLDGEIAISSNKGDAFKVGDGSTAWSSLPYTVEPTNYVKKDGDTMTGALTIAAALQQTIIWIRGAFTWSQGVTSLGDFTVQDAANVVGRYRADDDDLLTQDEVVTRRKLQKYGDDNYSPLVAPASSYGTALIDPLVLTASFQPLTLSNNSLPGNQPGVFCLSFNSLVTGTNPNADFRYKVTSGGNEVFGPIISIGSQTLHTTFEIFIDADGTTTVEALGTNATIDSGSVSSFRI